MSLLSVLPAILRLFLSVLALQQVSAVKVAPTNDTLGDNVVNQFVMETTLNMTPLSTNINPLTGPAGLQGGTSQAKKIHPTGILIQTNPQNVPTFLEESIAYISCEPGDYSGELDASWTLDQVIRQGPKAIVLYSRNAAQCNFDAEDFDFPLMYTMLSAQESGDVYDKLMVQSPREPTATISVNQNSGNGSDGNGNNGNVLGKSPTTAVAMIILYSITGIITFLFLAIIVIGAIRAHRHPERYGPRRMIGRPRQSRARGLARAMLETLPIVKFGDQPGDKPPEGAAPNAENGRDVELGGGPHAAATSEGTEHGDNATVSHTEASTADRPDVVVTRPVGSETAEEAKEESAQSGDLINNDLACSVCTDDFVKGQDIRLLPCKHKFHPECIDPWLLNVSGTCPLCRVDLRPTTSRGEPAEGEDEEYFDDGPSLEVQETTYIESTDRRHRRSRILSTLNIGRMRHATPEERIAALRRLRSENQTNESTAGSDGTRNRFSRRVSRVLGGSRRNSAALSSRPISEIPPNAAEAVPPPPTATPSNPTPTTRSPPTSEGGDPSMAETAPPLPPTPATASHSPARRSRRSTVNTTSPSPARRSRRNTLTAASPSSRRSTIEDETSAAAAAGAARTSMNLG